MPEKKVQFLTLMFVDIPSAVSVRETEGSDAEREFLDHCISILSVVRKQHNGNLLRTVGSTVLCSFEKGEDALLAAAKMQQSIERTPAKTMTPAVLRIGLHAGDVTLKGGSCTGDVVTTSARIVTLAKPQQILATDQVYEQIPARLRHRLDPLEDAQGLERRLGVRLFEVQWREEKDGPSVRHATTKIAVVDKGGETPPGRKAAGTAAAKRLPSLKTSVSLPPRPAPPADADVLDLTPQSKALDSGSYPALPELKLKPDPAAPAAAQSGVHPAPSAASETSAGMPGTAPAPPVAAQSGVHPAPSAASETSAGMPGTAPAPPAAAKSGVHPAPSAASETSTGMPGTAPAAPAAAPGGSDAPALPLSGSSLDATRSLDKEAMARAAAGRRRPLKKKFMRRRIVLREVDQKTPRSEAAETRARDASSRKPAAEPQAEARKLRPPKLSKQPEAPAPSPPPPAEDTPVTAPALAAVADGELVHTGPSAVRMCLILHQKLVVLDSGRPAVTMGRDESNDLVLGSDTASRNHAEVEFHNGGFYVVDHSWNGTFLYDENGVETHLHNERVPLGRGGVICPGCPGDEEEVEAIRFILAS